MISSFNNSFPEYLLTEDWILLKEDYKLDFLTVYIELKLPKIVCINYITVNI